MKANEIISNLILHEDYAIHIDSNSDNSIDITIEFKGEVIYLQRDFPPELVFEDLESMKWNF